MRNIGCSIKGVNKMKHVLKKTAVLLFAVALSTAAMAGVEEGVAAYEKKDFATALRELKPLAQKGDAVAQAYLGTMYHDGKGVQQDYAEAVKWIRKAAEQGRANAQYELAFMYAEGQGIKKDFAEAEKWARKAAEQGHLDAQRTLGGVYSAGLGVQQNFAEALNWWRKAIAQGDKDAEHQMALAYKNGVGTERDLPTFISIEEKLAQQNFAPAQFEYGYALLTGQGAAVDKTKAGEWLNRAAVAGNPFAQQVLAFELYNGQNFKKDLVQAGKWAQKAAEQEAWDSQRLLGIMYRKGEGMQKNPPEAMRWFQKAAEYGDAFATSSVAEMYFEGDGIPLDCQAATKWFKKAQALGEQSVESKLEEINSGACKYHEEWADVQKIQNKASGELQQKDPELYKTLGKQLISKLSLLVSKDVNAARCRLGGILFSDQFWELKDNRQKEGLDLLKKGAGLGGLDCIGAIMVYRGQGIGEDLVSTSELNAWKLRAVELGSSQAMGDLAYCYEFGKDDVEQNYVKAYMWRYIEAERTHKSADEAVAHLLPRLTPKKLEAARKMIEEWKRKHPVKA